jgi:acyl-CoA thioesterase
MNDAARPPSSGAQILAERVAEVMYARDRASQALGMKIVEVRPGYARMTMTVRNDMLNGHATCHGGFIFALADSAFAFACNSHNQITVASGCAIEYLAPGREGTTLSAEAVEQATTGRTGVYDIAVTDEDGKRIAMFRGKSYRIKGEVIAGLNTEAR